MRNATVNTTTLIIAATLVLAAALFARARSHARSRAAPTPEAAPTAALQRLGETVFAEECGFCHGTDSEAVSSLADFVVRASAVEGGSAYVVDFLLFGLEGDAPDEPSHPPFDHLANEQIAAVLAWLSRLSPEPAGSVPRQVALDAVEERRAGGPDARRVSAERRRVLEASDGRRRP